MQRSRSIPELLLVALAVCALAGLEAGCASPPAEPEGPPVRHTYPPVPGEAFLRAEKRTLLAREVRLELPLHLESELFLRGNEVKRWTAEGKKLKAAYGLAGARFADGLEIREAEHILVTFPSDCDRIRLEARGSVVFIDQAENRVVREATGMELNANTPVFHGPYQDERLK